MARANPASPARAGEDPAVPMGARVGIAVGAPLLAAAVSWVAAKYWAGLPNDAMTALYAFAAAFGVVLAIAVPWRGALTTALIVGAVFGTLTYSHPARDHAAAGLSATGAWIGRHLPHRGGGGG